MSKKAKIIIAGLLVFWLLAMLLFVFIFKDERPQYTVDPDPINGVHVTNPDAYDLENHDMNVGEDIELKEIVGFWMSDRSDSNMVEIKEDGTFTDTNLMGIGKVSIHGNFIILTNGAEQKYVFKYQDSETTGEKELYYTVDVYENFYHKASEAEIEKKQAEMDAEADELAACKNQAEIDATKVLTSKIWTNSNGDSFQYRVDKFFLNDTPYEFTLNSVEEVQGDPSGFSLNMESTGHNIPVFLLFTGSSEPILAIEFEMDGVSYKFHGTDNSEPVKEPGTEDEAVPESPAPAVVPTENGDKVIVQDSSGQMIGIVGDNTSDVTVTIESE